MSETTVHVDDGRVLEIRASGPETGFPLLFHHGTPGSRAPLRALERAAHAHGFRYVTWSRPGYGGSSPRPHRAVIDVVPDAVAILDRIGSARCVVAGWSGGGPHALATAARLPDRVLGVLSIASVAPADGPGLDFLAGMGQQNIEEFQLARAGDASLRAWAEQAAAEARRARPGELIDQLTTLLPPVDQAVITGELAEDLVSQDAEAFRVGVEGWVQDDMAFLAPWGFDVAQVQVPTFLWHGTEDLMVPVAHGHWLAANLGDPEAHLEVGEGHLSIAVGALDRMMAELASLAGSSV